MSPPLELFHPRIRQWFRDRFGSPTDIQDRAWPVIARGEHVLITAPTGSGKTLTAFLWALNQLITGAWPSGGTRVLYVSPLNNDIQRNLIEPLAELERIFAEAGEAFPQIRVSSRSGDTPPSERQRMVRHPPEILITTPESLNLLHTSPKARHIPAGISFLRTYGRVSRSRQRSIGIQRFQKGTSRSSRARGRCRRDADRAADEVEAPTKFLEEWIRFYGPLCRSAIQEKLGVEDSSLDGVLEALVETRSAIRGHLIGGAEEIEYCDAENYEVPLRLTRRATSCDSAADRYATAVSGCASVHG